MKCLLSFGLLLASLNFALANDLESLLEGGNPVDQVGHASAVKFTKMSPLVSTLRRVIGAPNTEQNIFLRYVEASEWDKASLQFPRAFEGTTFQKSANGRAMFGLALFRAGLPVRGLQTLFLAESPQQISEVLQEEWRTSAPVSHYAWGLAHVSWRQDWENIFGLDHSLWVKTEEILASQSPTIEDIEKLSAQATANSYVKGRLDWQIVLSYALKDQADKAALVLSRLMKNPQAPVSQDLMQITAARLLFQNGYFDSSIKYYEKVSKSSEYWTEAQEETAWAYIRKGEPNNAKAVTQSLVHPSMAYMVTPEGFFINSLARLKVCDYAGVVASLGDFPKRFKERTKTLEKMSVDASTPDVIEVLAKLQSKRLRLEDLGNKARNLPRRFSNDENLYSFAQKQKYLEAEARAAEKLYAQSLALTGLQSTFEAIRNVSLQGASSAKSASLNRVKQLAAVEVSETKDILRKLHIVEAEVIQQVSLADKIVKSAKPSSDDKKMGVTGYKGSAEVIKFPAEEEVWFDEISRYRVDVKKACTVKR